MQMAKRMSAILTSLPHVPQSLLGYSLYVAGQLPWLGTTDDLRNLRGYLRYSMSRRASREFIRE